MHSVLTTSSGRTYDAYSTTRNKAGCNYTLTVTEFSNMFHLLYLLTQVLTTQLGQLCSRVIYNCFITTTYLKKSERPVWLLRSQTMATPPMSIVPFMSTANIEE